MTSRTGKDVCLVTGGAGFIGSHLVEHLIDQGKDVVVVDDLSTGRLDNLKHVDSSRCRIVQGRVAESLRSFQLDEFIEIYHLAAAVGVRLVVEEPIRTIETNILETSAILQFAAKASTPILIASSSEVYGKGAKTPFSESDDVVYGPTSLSRWSYGCSKAIDEFLAFAHHKESGLPVSVVRFFNMVGPRQVGHYGMVLPRFVEAGVQNEPIQVYGNGKQTRCFCDVRDAVRVLPDILSTDGLIGTVVNLGSDQPIQIRTLAKLVVETLKSNSAIEYVPYEKAFGHGFEDLMDRVPDLSRLKSQLSFNTSVSLEQTILDVADQYQCCSSNVTSESGTTEGRLRVQ